MCRLKDDKISNKEIAEATELPQEVVDALLMNPKSYRSAFTLFQASARGEGLGAGVPLSEQMRLMAERWKSLSEEERRPFTSVADQAKTEGAELDAEWVRFQEQLREDTAPAPVEAPSRADRVERLEVAPKPKKPRVSGERLPKPVVRHAVGDLRNLMQDIAPLRSRCPPSPTRASPPHLPSSALSVRTSCFLCWRALAGCLV